MLTLYALDIYDPTRGFKILYKYLKYIVPALKVCSEQYRLKRNYDRFFEKKDKECR